MSRLVRRRPDLGEPRRRALPGARARARRLPRHVAHRRRRLLGRSARRRADLRETCRRAFTGAGPGAGGLPRHIAHLALGGIRRRPRRVAHRVESGSGPLTGTSPGAGRLGGHVPHLALGAVSRRPSRVADPIESRRRRVPGALGITGDGIRHVAHLGLGAVSGLARRSPHTVERLLGGLARPLHRRRAILGGTLRSVDTRLGALLRRLARGLADLVECLGHVLFEGGEITLEGDLRLTNLRHARLLPLFAVADYPSQHIGLRPPIRLRNCAPGGRRRSPLHARPEYLVLQFFPRLLVLAALQEHVVYRRQ